MTCRWCQVEAFDDLVAAGFTPAVARLLADARLTVAGWWPVVDVAVAA